jgi:hypothetical protein
MEEEIKDTKIRDFHVNVAFEVAAFSRGRSGQKPFRLFVPQGKDGKEGPKGRWLHTGM